MELTRLENDRLQLTFLPGAGGRLLSVRIDDVEVLWQNPVFFDAALGLRVPREEWAVVDGTFRSWSNLGGSKTWPAPQGWSGAGQWPGPPDDVLDSGVWGWRRERGPEGSDIAVLTSPDDERTGLRIERVFELPPRGARFQQRITLTNVSREPIAWAAWEVCQIGTARAPGAAAGRVEIDVAGTADPVDLGAIVGSLRLDREPGVVRIVPQPVVAKAGFPDASGRVSWTAGTGEGVELRFTPDPAAEYPDGGSRAEIWMQTPIDAPLEELGGLHPADDLIEIEVLGPLTPLAPGEQSALEIEWTIFPPTP